MFKLHETLEKDLVEICNLKLSKLMLLPDSENPWVVLVPMRDDIREICELEWDDQVELLREINMISRYLSSNFSPDKLNIGALGNMVPQLHIHLIARFKTDRAWPGAIWGTKSTKETHDINKLEISLREVFDV